MNKSVTLAVRHCRGKRVDFRCVGTELFTVGHGHHPRTERSENLSAIVVLVFLTCVIHHTSYVVSFGPR